MNNKAFLFNAMITLSVASLVSITAHGQGRFLEGLKAKQNNPVQVQTQASTLTAPAVVQANPAQAAQAAQVVAQAVQANPAQAAQAAQVATQAAQATAQAVQANPAQAAQVATQAAQTTAQAVQANPAQKSSDGIRPLLVKLLKSKLQ